VRSGPLFPSSTRKKKERKRAPRQRGKERGRKEGRKGRKRTLRALDVSARCNPEEKKKKKK